MEVFRDAGGVLYDNFHFAQATRSGNLLLCSGVIGNNPDGSVPEEFADEARNAWNKVRELLESAGLGLDAVVEYTTFHVGLQSSMRDFMQVRDEFLSEPWPAWTAIGISELAIPGSRLELRVTAEFK